MGDLQRGDRGFREDLWDRWKKDVLADKDAYIIGLGDYSNSFRPTIQKELKRAFIKDNEAHQELDYMVMKEMQALADELKPFKKRIIGLLEGHHFHSMLAGTSSTQYLCQLLGVKYLGFVGLVRLAIMRGNSGPYSIDIFATHGQGGSSFSATDLGNLERKIMPYWNFDIYLRGHSTKVYAAPGGPLSYLSTNRNGVLKLHHRKRWLCNTGGFMEGYVQGQTGYVEEKNLSPCALGWVTIAIHQKSNGEFEISPTVNTP